MAFDLDDLFLNGVPLEEEHGFILKAQLKVPQPDFHHPVVKHLFLEMRDLFANNSRTMEEKIADVLSRARSIDKAFLVSIPFDRTPSDTLMKAVGRPTSTPPKPKAQPTGNKPPSVQARAAGTPRQDPKAPGIRGGKFYRTKSGKIVYGTQPNPQMHEREATDEEVAEHAQKQLNPSLFTLTDEKLLSTYMDSGVFTEDDVDMLMTLRNNIFAPALEAIGVDPKDVDAQTVIKNAFNQKGNHLKMLDWTKQVLMENLVDEETTEADIEEFWNDMQEKYAKAGQDPKVQAQLKRAVIEHEQNINTYNYNIERTKEMSKDLLTQVVHGENQQDNALTNLFLMKEMGLMFVPKKGEVAKRASKKDTNGSLHLKGTMQPDTTYLDSISVDSDEKRGEKAVNLSRMNEAQLAALYVADVMSTTRNPNGDFNTSDSWEKTKEDSPLVKALREKLGTTDVAFKHTMDRLNEIGKDSADLANKFNNGELPGLNEFFTQDEDEGSNPLKEQKIQEVRQKIQEMHAEREAIMKSQEDESFALPKAMKGGFWDKPLPNGKTPKPFSWQAKAVNWISTVKRGILGYDMGMGKTASVIAATTKLIDEGKIEGSILILPPVLMAQWPNEIQTYAPGIKPEEVLDLSPYSLEERKLMLKSDIARKAKFIIMSSGSLTDPKDAKAQGQEEEGVDNDFIEAINALPNRMVSVDEVHTGGYKTGAANPEDMGVRYRLMSQMLKDREYAIGMTGTPMPNSPIDTFNLTDLFAPGKVGSRDQWEGTLSNTVYDEETGQRTISNPDKLAELRDRLRPYVFVKEVSDDDVAPELKDWLPPPPTMARNPGVEGGVLKPSTKKGANGLSQEDYFNGGIDRIADMRIGELNAQRERRGLEPFAANAAQMIHRLIRVGLMRQAAISPALIDPSYGPDSPAPKLDMAMEQIKQHFNGGWGKNGEPVVVFGSTVKSFELLQRKLKQNGITPDQVGVISADASPEERAYIQDATNEGKIKVVMVGIKSGGAGLNLQKASNHMIFLDNPWTPADKRQAMTRVQRVQQKKNVLMTTFSMEGTYDPIIEEKLADKQTMSEALLGDDASWTTDADQKIRAMMGGISPGKRPKFTADHEKTFAEIAQGLKDDGAELLKDKNLNDVGVNEEARKTLPENLRQEFDRAKDMKAWRQKRAEKTLNSRIKGLESLIETMKKELDPKHPETKQKLQDLTSRLQNLKSAGGEQFAMRGPAAKEPKEAPKAPASASKPAKEEKAAKETPKAKEAPKEAPKAKQEAPKATETAHSTKDAAPKLKVHSYKANSNKKRHGVPESELAAVHDMLKRHKGSVGSFLNDVIKPAWDGKWNEKAALKDFNKWMTAFKNDGLVH